MVMEGHPIPRSRRRRRAALSCSECRRRKIKCDHSDPCAHCVRQKARCVYDGDPGGPRQPRQPGSLAITTHDSADIGSRTNAAARGSVADLHVRHQAGVWTPVPTVSTTTTAAAYDGASPISMHPSDTRSRSTNPTGSPPGTLQRMPQADPEPEASSVSGLVDRPARELPEAAQENPPRPPPSVLQDWQAVLSKPRDLGRSRWKGGSHAFSAIIGCYKAMVNMDVDTIQTQGSESAMLHSQAGEFLQKCKASAKKIKVGRPSRSFGTPPLGVGLVPPSRSMSDAMVNIYFIYIESTHRILHGPTFRMQYSKFWNQPESAPLELRLQVLLVVGIGSSLHDHGNTQAALQNTEMVQQWIFAAQTWLSGPMEKDRLTISGLQIYCLTLLARQIFSIGGDLVWVSTGSLVHEAMQMGLNRDPKHLPGMSVLEGEIRRRLWATILEMVVQSSLDAWMPARISLDEFDTEPPSNVNDEDMDRSTTTLQPHSQDTFTDTSTQLVLLASLPTRLRIVQLLNGMHSDLSYPRVLALSSELTDALRKISTSPKNDPQAKHAPFHRNLLDYLVRRFMMPLHLSSSTQANSNPLFHYSLKASLDAALAIVTPEPCPAFHRLMVLGGGMFREGMRAALTAVGQELLVLTEAQKLDGTLRRAGQQREILKRVAHDLVELAAERIRLGETNVKSHMFLSMILAQVDAVEADESVELRLARAARDSLAFCHEILAARAAGMSMVTTPAASGLAGIGGGVNDGFGDFDADGAGMDWDWQSFMPDVLGSQWANPSQLA